MKRIKKSWRAFKGQESARQKRVCRWIRRICSIMLLVEIVVLWKQGWFPLISVDEQEESWMRQMDSSVAAGQWDHTVLEEIFGVRLKVEDGVIEFYRKEEQVEVIPKSFAR